MTVDPTRIECDFCGNDTRRADFWRAVEQRAARFAAPAEAARLRLRRAALLASAGRREEALQAYRDTAGNLKGAARAEAVEETGDILVKLEREEEARAAYREAIALRPAG